MAETWIQSQSVAETVAVGAALGRALRGGEVFAVNGALGSGKTQVIKGIVAGVGAASSEEVNSPTFVLLNEYEGRLTVAKLNIDDNPNTPPKYGIRGIPTLMLFKNGNVEATKVGALSKSQLTAFIDGNL